MDGLLRRTAALFLPHCCNTCRSEPYIRVEARVSFLANRIRSNLFSPLAANPNPSVPFLFRTASPLHLSRRHRLDWGISQGSISQSARGGRRAEECARRGKNRATWGLGCPALNGAGCRGKGRWDEGAAEAEQRAPEARVEKGAERGAEKRNHLEEIGRSTCVEEGEARRRKGRSAGRGASGRGLHARTFEGLWERRRGGGEWG